MKTSRILGWGLAVLIIGAIAVAGGVYWHYLRERTEGVRLWNEGREALAAQESVQAISRFDAALSKPLDDQTKADAYALRGKARQEPEAIDAVIADFSSALRLDPRRGAIYRDRARAYQAKGEKEKAIADYSAAIARGSNGAEEYFARGTLLLEDGEAEKAAADFTEVTQRAPENVSAFVLRGRAYSAMNDLEAAIASYDSALGIDPKNQEARRERGDLHSKKGDVEKAMADYAELRTPVGDLWATKREQEWAAGAAQTAAPKKYASTAALFAKAADAFAAGRLDDALDVYNAILSADVPLTAASTACQNRGSIYRAKGDTEKALRDYQQAIRFNPANAGAYVNRGLIYAGRGDTEAAIKDYDEALRFDPRMVEARFDRALGHGAEGNFDAAERDLTEVLRLNPKFAPAHAERAAIYVSKGKLDQALSEDAAAARLDPTLARVHSGRAVVYMKKGKYERAASEFEKAIQLKPANVAESLNSLAWLRATCPQKSARSGKKAVEAALQACELTYWASASVIDTLAAGYAEDGQFENAAKFQGLALSMPSMGLESRSGAEQRLKLYQQRLPYRGDGID